VKGNAHKWEFRARFRRQAFGWKSEPAIKRVKEAVAEITAHDEGILCAPTAFGKTAVAAWLIAKRKVNTLVLRPLENFILKHFH